MSRYPRERIEARLHSSALASAYRILGLAHLEEPLRISRPLRDFATAIGYGVLYAAVSFRPAFLKLWYAIALHVVPGASCRSRPSGTCWAHIATKANHGLKLLDLRGSGCVEIGRRRRSCPTLAAGQSLGRAVYEEHRDVDGFIYSSRLTGEICIAVFDRAVDKLTVWTPAN